VLKQKPGSLGSPGKAMPSSNLDKVTQVPSKSLEKNNPPPAFRWENSLLSALAVSATLAKRLRLARSYCQSRACDSPRTASCCQVLWRDLDPLGSGTNPYSIAYPRSATNPNPKMSSNPVSAKGGIAVSLGLRLSFPPIRSKGEHSTSRRSYSSRSPPPQAFPARPWRLPDVMFRL